MHQSRAIVLRQIKYSETSLILKIYTEKEGLLSFIVKGVRGKKGRFRSAQFQPLNLIDISYREARKSELRHIIDLKVVEPFTDLLFNPVKRTIAIFIAELIQNVIKEEEPNAKLFDLEEAFIKLRGIPISLLKFFKVFELFFRVLLIIFVVVVFPLLPVIAITLPP